MNSYRRYIVKDTFWVLLWTPAPAEYDYTLHASNANVLQIAVATEIQIELFDLADQQESLRVNTN